MRKLTLFLALAMTIQNCLSIMPCLAEDNNDALKIEEAIKGYWKGIAIGELDSAMQYVSVNYSDKSDNKVADYNTVKSNLEKNKIFFTKTYVDYSMNEPRLNNLDIQDNKATVEVEIIWKGFNLETLKEDTGRQRKIIFLAKEDGSWKITQLKQLK